MCKHKPLFSPFDHSDTLIALITFVTIMLAAPSGIGGGGILVSPLPRCHWLPTSRPCCLPPGRMPPFLRPLYLCAGVQVALHARGLWWERGVKGVGKERSVLLALPSLPALPCCACQSATASIGQTVRSACAERG